MRPDYAREVRSALTDAAKLCAGLGLAKGALPQASGLLICCPVHGDRTPSCSVTRGPDGTVRVRCFACDFSADALGLIAHVQGLSTRDADGFREVLAEGARLAGMLQLEAEIRDGKPRQDRPKVEAPQAGPPPSYPDRDELAALWMGGTHPAEDPEASRYLVGRMLDPQLVGDRELARVVVPPLPVWAQYGRRTWAETGHRLIVRAMDSNGRTRSVRAIQVRTSDPPKRLPPKGRKAAGLVLANHAAQKMLRGEVRPRVVIVEGEPDFLQWSTLTEDPVIGLVAGSWGDDFAKKIPRGSRVAIRTHEDMAGEKYAAQVVASLAGRECVIRRSSTEAA